MIGERTKMMDDKCKRLLDGGPWDLMASALLPAYSTPIAMAHGHGLFLNRFASQGVSEGRGCQTLNARCIRYRRHDASQKAGVVILILEADTGHQALGIHPFGKRFHRKKS